MGEIVEKESCEPFTVRRYRLEVQYTVLPDNVKGCIVDYKGRMYILLHERLQNSVDRFEILDSLLNDHVNYLSSINPSYSMKARLDT